MFRLSVQLIKTVIPAVTIMVAALAPPLQSKAAESDPGQTANRPNIIFILSDDVGLGEPIEGVMA